MPDNQSLFDILNFSWSRKVEEPTYYACRLDESRWLCKQADTVGVRGRLVKVPASVPIEDHSAHLLVALAYPVVIEKSMW